MFSPSAPAQWGAQTPPVSPIADESGDSSLVDPSFAASPAASPTSDSSFDTFGGDDPPMFRGPMDDMAKQHKKDYAYAALDATWRARNETSDLGASWDESDVKDVISSIALAVIEGRAALDKVNPPAAYEQFKVIWSQLQRLRGIPLASSTSDAGDGAVVAKEVLLLY